MNPPKTGRFTHAASDTQKLLIPRAQTFKDAFRPKPGKVCAMPVDYSALELQILAALEKESQS